MAKWVRRSVEDWRGIIERFEKSGLTQIAFAKEHGLCRATLCAWIARFKEPSGERSEVSSVLGMNSSSLSFLELSPSKEVASFPFLRPVRCEIAFPEGIHLRIENGVTWDQIEGFMQTLLDVQQSRV